MPCAFSHGTFCLWITYLFFPEQSFEEIGNALSHRAEKLCHAVRCTRGFLIAFHHLRQRLRIQVQLVQFHQKADELAALGIGKRHAIRFAGFVHCCRNARFVMKVVFLHIILEVCQQLLDRARIQIGQRALQITRHDQLV